MSGKAGQRQRADDHHDIGIRDAVLQAAHVPHVLLVMHGEDHRAGAEEQQRLEEGVREQVEHADRIGADAHGDEHVAELRAGRIGDDALDVVLHQADGRREHGRGGADEDDEALRIRREFEQRRQPRHHEHAGGHHGRRMDQRGDRRRAFHGVGQPGVQQELRRLAHRAHEQQQADERQRVGMPAEERHGLADQRGRLRKDGVEIDRADQANSAKMPSAKPKSPTRLTTKALIAAALASGL